MTAAEKMQAYIATARRRQQQRQAQLHQRRQQGLELAKTAAHILQEEFGVSRVVLFGSALDATHFHETSDLDLAVWDLPPADTLQAVARLLQLPHFSIDLVDAETASPYLKAGISEGITL